MRIVKVFWAAAALACGLAASGAAQARAADSVYCVVDDLSSGKAYYSSVAQGDFRRDLDYQKGYLAQVQSKYPLGPAPAAYCFSAPTPADAGTALKQLAAVDAKGGKTVVTTGLAPTVTVVAAAAPQPDIELECAMQTGSQNVEGSGRITLSPNGSWRLSFNPSRRTVTMKKWFAYNAPAVTEQPTSVSITADQIKFCLLASGCGDNGMAGFVELDRRAGDLQWNYIVGLERENGPMFQTVMYGKCDLFKEKPQAF